jgi:hypothetical protein
LAPSRRIRIALWIAISVLVALSATVAVLVARFQPVARNYVLSALKQRYKSDIELGNLQISLFPLVRATGDNLVLRVPGRKDLPPLIEIRRFVLEARFIGFFRYPKRIRRLTLQGLQIHIQPKSARSRPRGSSTPNIPFILEDITADGTTLQTFPSDPSKSPLTFNIRQLHLHTVGKNVPMNFQAALDNAKPPGLIHSTGQFGPWNEDDAGGTPVSGSYTFRNADLSVFKGINGILASDGTYRGELDRIEVSGTTDTPDFSLDIADHPLHLRTSFAATVDGTNGDTDLHPVHALLGDSAFEVSGSIARNAPGTHKEIDLKASAGKTGLDDFLRLAVKSARPPMTGTIAFNTTVKIPPGDKPVVDRLQLDGRFTLNRIRFTSTDVQQKIASLSHHAKGEPKETSTRDVTADFAGNFHLRDGNLTLPQLAFQVPGADVNLHGQYGLRSGELDFQGTAKLEAKVSEMTTGVKSVLLKAVDPLFTHDGAGTELPITIGGTRGSPSFHLDIGRALFRK